MKHNATDVFCRRERRLRRRRARAYPDVAGERKAAPMADVLNVFTNNRKRRKDSQ